MRIGFLYCDDFFHNLPVHTWMFTHEMQLFLFELFHHCLIHKAIAYWLLVDIFQIEKALYA